MVEVNVCVRQSGAASSSFCSALTVFLLKYGPTACEDNNILVLSSNCGKRLRAFRGVSAFLFEKRLNKNSFLLPHHNHGECVCLCVCARICLFLVLIFVCAYFAENM